MSDMLTRKAGHFVDIVAIGSANADGILHAIDQSLVRIGITETTLQQKLVGCNFDGASMMLGSKTGVATQLNNRVNQNIVIMHCVAHNLELGVGDAIRTVPYLQSFFDNVSQIFRFYYYSPKKGENFMALLTSLRNRLPTTVVALRKPDGLPVETELCWP